MKSWFVWRWSHFCPVFLWNRGMPRFFKEGFSQLHPHLAYHFYTCHIHSSFLLSFFPVYYTTLFQLLVFEMPNSFSYTEFTGICTYAGLVLCTAFLEFPSLRAGPCCLLDGSDLPPQKLLLLTELLMITFCKDWKDQLHLQVSSFNT